MRTKDIKISAEARTAIEALQHNCGTYRYYDDTISRLFNYVLEYSDEMGMDDTEAMSTLRTLQNLRYDLASIAGNVALAVKECRRIDDDETPAEKVESTFSGCELEPNHETSEPNEDNQV